jgi:hypothetical protein
MLTDQHILYNFALFAADSQQVHDDSICLDDIRLAIRVVFGSEKYNHEEIDSAIQYVKDYRSDCKLI